MMEEEDYVGYEDDYRNERCAICLEPILEICAKAKEDCEPENSPQNSGLVPLFDTCSHFFCRKELLTWLEQRNECPLCRGPVYVDEERFRQAYSAIMKFRATSMEVCRMLVELKDCVRRFRSQRVESALLEPLQSENRTQVHLNVDIQLEAPSATATQQTEDSEDRDHGNSKTDMQVVSEVQEASTGEKMQSESTKAELEKDLKVALARLNVLGDFFKEISDEMENIHRRMSESEVFLSISISMPVSSLLALVQATLTRVPDAEEAGAGAGAGDGDGAGDGAGAEAGNHS